MQNKKENKQNKIKAQHTQLAKKIPNYTYLNYFLNPNYNLVSCVVFKY